jgi:hypothetical protein
MGKTDALKMSAVPNPRTSKQHDRITRWPDARSPTVVRKQVV